MGTGNGYSTRGSHAKAMNRSIRRLGGIAFAFSRGFRSTASVAMPIKVRLTCFSICGVRSSYVCPSSLDNTRGIAES